MHNFCRQGMVLDNLHIFPINGNVVEEVICFVLVYLHMYMCVVVLGMFERGCIVCGLFYLKLSTGIVIFLYSHNFIL